TLANEDTALELAMLPARTRHVVCVAGSGSRALPLFAKAPERVALVDLSQEQLWLTELRIAAVRALSREQYLAFFGYAGFAADGSKRQAIFRSLELSAGAREFFAGLFQALNWQSL